MKIPVGIEIKTNNVILVEDLPDSRRGLKCRCICPECGSKLVAKLGGNMTHHFAHYSGTETSKCQMTALHLLGQYALSKLTQISIREYREYRIKNDIQHDILNREYESDEIKLFGETPIRIKSTILEKAVGTIRSDVFASTIYDNVSLDINFEVKVWHEVDDVKSNKVKKLKLNTIEIDLLCLIDEQNVTFDMVVKELNNPINQSIIYLDDSFIYPYQKRAEEDLLNRIELENIAIKSWVEKISNQLVSNGLQLPPYNYNFNGIPNNYLKKRIYKLLPQRPKIEKIVNVERLNCHPDGYLDLEIIFAGTTHTLPILLQNADSSILQSCEASYLIMGEKYLESDLYEIKFKWGENKIASSFQDTCNGIISKQISINKKNDREKVSNFIATITEMKNTGKYVKNSNYLSIRKRANQYYNEMINKGYSPTYLKELINNEVDPLQIYGCEAKYWQLIVIRDICWVSYPQVAVPFLSKRLNDFGISPVPPFSSLLYKSKVMKQNNIDMPFTTPYKLLSSYLKHLGNNRFLSVQGGGRFIKTELFGDEYKKL